MRGRSCLARSGASLWLALVAVAVGCGESAEQEGPSAATSGGAGTAGSSGTNAGGIGSGTGGIGVIRASGGAASGGNASSAGGAGGDSAAEGGAGGGGGGAAATCTEEELLAALPDHFKDGVGNSACMPGGTYSGSGTEVTFCDDEPCSCMADLVWDVTLDGSTLTAIAPITGSVPIDYDILGSTGSCTGTFGGTLTYTATIGTSTDGGELHTTASEETWTIDMESLTGCNALGSVRSTLAQSIADEMLADIQGPEYAAIVASNVCP